MQNSNAGPRKSNGRELAYQQRIESKVCGNEPVHAIKTAREEKHYDEQRS